MSADWSGPPVAVPFADFSDPQTLNLYAYIGKQSLGGVDADGHIPEWLKGVGDGIKSAGKHAGQGIATLAKAANGDPMAIAAIGTGIAGTAQDGWNMARHTSATFDSLKIGWTVMSGREKSATVTDI